MTTQSRNLTSQIITRLVVNQWQCTNWLDQLALTNH